MDDLGQIFELVVNLALITEELLNPLGVDGRYVFGNLILLLGTIRPLLKPVSKVWAFFRNKKTESKSDSYKLEMDKLRFEVLKLKLQVMQFGGEHLQQKTLQVIEDAILPDSETPGSPANKKDRLRDFIVENPRRSLLLVPLNLLLGAIGLIAALISLVFYYVALVRLTNLGLEAAQNAAATATVFLIIAWFLLTIPYRSIQGWRAAGRGKTRYLVGSLITLGLNLFTVVVTGVAAVSPLQPTFPSNTPVIIPTETRQTPTVIPPPTRTPTPQIPTPTPSPAAENLIKNGGFERDYAWVFKPTVRKGSYDSTVVHSGSNSALVGIIDPRHDAYSFSSVSQKVTIPDNASRVTLTAYIYPVYEGNHSRDLQLTLILDQNFREIERLSSMLSNDRTWQKQTFNLTRYAGRTIYIYFGVVNRLRDGSITAVYVDDVSLMYER